MTKAYKPPLVYPGLLRGVVVHQWPGLVASLLPLLLPVVGIAYLEEFSRGDDGYLVSMIVLALIGPCTVLPVHLTLRKLPAYSDESAGVLGMCSVFVVWGLPATLMGLFVLGPLVCTAFWSVLVGTVLRRRRAWNFFWVQGFIGFGLIWAAVILASRRLTVDPVVLPSMLAWHLLHAFTLAFAAELHRRDLEHLRSRCRRCGYPREGLEPGGVCPECGGFRSTHRV